MSAQHEAKINSVLEPQPKPQLLPDPETLSAQLAALPSLRPRARRRTGKVAQLPKHLREKINLLLEDGATYPAIIHALGPDGAHLTIDNLSQWKNGGYQDWIQEEEYRWLFNNSFETAAAIGKDMSACDVLQRLLRITAFRMIHHLVNLEEDPETRRFDKSWLRVIGLVPRITKLVIDLRKANASPPNLTHNPNLSPPPSFPSPETIAQALGPAVGPSHSAPAPKSFAPPKPPPTRSTPMQTTPPTPEPLNISPLLHGTEPLYKPSATPTPPISKAASALIAEAFSKLESGSARNPTRNRNLNLSPPVFVGPFPQPK